MDEIHASSLRSFASCEQAGLYRYRNPERRPPHISSYIGHKVHAEVLQDEPYIHDREDAFVYDRITPTMAKANSQAARMTRKLRRLLREDLSIQLSETEREHEPVFVLDDADVRLVGRTDLTGWLDGRRVILDLKTGGDDTQAWLQLGAYALLIGDDNPMLGVIHAPRTTVGGGLEEPVLRWAKKPDEIVEHARDRVERIARLIAYPHQHRPMVNPGRQCQWCDHPDCAVRAVDFFPHV